MPMPPPKLSDEDNRLLRAWRRGDLDEEASLAFETRLFLEPGLLRAAQIDEAMAGGLGDEAQGRQPGREPAWPWKLVAGLALAAGMAGAVLWPLRQDTPTLLAAGKVEWVSLDVRRGGGEPMMVAPGPDTRLLALEVPVPGGDDGLYDLSVIPATGGQAPIQVSRLSAEQGMLNLAFEREALPPGVYFVEIRAHGEQEGQPLQKLAFRYRR